MATVDMNERDFTKICYIRKYCSEIIDSIQRFGKEYDIFAREHIYFNSISMCLLQIGELTKKLSDSFKDATSEKISWRKIIGMRNLFAHDYLNMKKEVIWSVAMDDIPALLEFCDSVIDKYKDLFIDE